MTELLTVKDLTIEFVSRGVVTNRPVRGMTFSIRPAEILAVVGESGCGKTLTGLAILDALPTGSQRGGTILVDGKDAREDSARVSIVFQNPGTAFNPVFTLGTQLRLVAERHRTATRAENRDHILRYLRLAGLNEPERILGSFPHQLSGGMLQRTMIAMALLCEPDLLILDEPTTALDVTVAKQILETILELRDSLGFGVLLITHNLGVVRDIADSVAVVYAGRVIEYGTTGQVLNHSRHPYTRGLLEAIPRRESREPLLAIPGTVPSNLLAVAGCSFAPRCAAAVESCTSIDPSLSAADPLVPAHVAACIRSAEL